MNNSLIVRFYNVFPVAPIVVGAFAGLSLIFLFLFYELLLDRYQLLWSAAEHGSALRNFRITIIHCLMITYAPTAYVYVIQTSQHTLSELRPVLRCTDSEFRDIVEATGKYDWWKLSLAVLIAMLMIVLVTIETTPADENPWSVASLTPEVVWHRAVGPIMACWSACFLYALIAESRRLHRTTSRMSAFDLLDLRPLKPLTHQALTNSLLILGYAAVMSLFLLEEGFGDVIVRAWILAILVALASLLLPVMGIHDRIRQDKLNELERCRIVLKQSRTELKNKLAVEQSSVQDSADETDQRNIPLAEIAAYQHLIEGVREWPFDTSTLLRFAVYLMIPLGSWFGGAMVERVVDGWLG